MQTIELYDDPDYLISAVLDNVLYFLHLSWNTEGFFWTMSIEDYNHEILISGVKIVPNYPLIRRYSLSGLPPGEFIVASEASIVSKSDFADQFATMVYVSESEL